MQATSCVEIDSEGSYKTAFFVRHMFVSGTNMTVVQLLIQTRTFQPLFTKEFMDINANQTRGKQYYLFGSSLDV